MKILLRRRYRNSYINSGGDKGTLVVLVLRCLATLGWYRLLVHTSVKYQITTSAEIAAGIYIIIFLFRLSQLRSTVLRILYLILAILYSVRLLYSIICIYNHQNHLPNIFSIIDLKVAFSIV